MRIDRASSTFHVNFALLLSRLAHELREDFDTALQGYNLKESDLKTLTGGARIANIFRERFPFELVKVNDREHRQRSLYPRSRWNYVTKICGIELLLRSRTLAVSGMDRTTKSFY